MNTLHFTHMRRHRIYFLALLAVTLAACGKAWNSPYPEEEAARNVLYTAFVERPKHLDPVQSYSEDEAVFNAQIYEPPLQYHYLKRPYTLIPQTAVDVPKPVYVDKAGNPVSAEAKDIAFSVYEVRIRPGIRYQPHPAFATDASGKLIYEHLSPEQTKHAHSLADFPKTGTRELVAEDYVYQIKRLAHPQLHSPVFGLMTEYIVGLKDYAAVLTQAYKEQSGRNGGEGWLDLRQYPLQGVEVVDRYTYRIKLNGRYPQFAYWLAMTFFAPVPVEVDRFFSHPGMAEKNLTLDRNPVGTGPYMLTENNPNSRMVLERNPNYHGETYPAEGESEDAQAGLLKDAGKAIPFIDKVVFSREKEGIPYWNKFLQGYYDSSGIASDTFDQAVRVSIEGDAAVTPEMEEKGIQLRTSVSTSTRYTAFNWIDPMVGGASERARKLRQAISIAVDVEEMVSIFANGRGISAQGPIAPGIFGYREGREGVNPVVYDWVDGAPRRKPIEAARKLLAEAGYPDGRDAKTGQPLVLYLDVTGRGPSDASRFDWYRKQFAKLNVQLEIRDTDYNRFQDKVRKGAAQILTWGWNADYPDPENFLFLLVSAQSKVQFNGENAANYSNAEYDALYEKMKNMENGPERQAIIDRMTAILRQDSPWIWGFHPKDYALYHSWLSNTKPNEMARNNIKYLRVDGEKRAALRAQWNRPMLWPLALIFAVLILASLPAVISYRRRERMAAKAA
jgi:oligopeptide transport system substrate-binding protein